MKECWEYKKLGDFCRKGKNIKWDDQTNDTSFRYIDLTSVDRNDLCIHNPQIITKDNAPSRAKQIIQAGDIIFATTRPTLRRVSLIDEQYDGDICSTGFCVLRPNKEVKSKIIFYALLNDSFYKYIEPLQTGANYPAVTDSIVKNYIIPVPPLSEQQRIVDYLDSAFAKIDAMKANAEKALNEAKALFQASLKEMLEPKEGWEKKIVKDLSFLITKGSSPKWQGNSYVNSEGILFVTSENVREGCLEFNPAKFVDNSFNIKQRRSILKKFDVLVNIVGASIGRAAIFDLDVENANINQAVCLIRLNWDKILPTYLCFFLNSDYAFKQYASMVKDAARANLSLENIGSLEIGIPSLSVQQSIVETLDSLKSQVEQLQENYEKISQECDALKQAILRQVFE